MLYLGITRHGGIELMAPQRLLVVEDDPGVRTTIVTGLELEGYEADSASSTKEAIDRLAAASYPMVISDIYIDNRTGLASLGAPRHREPSCAGTPHARPGHTVTGMVARPGAP